MSFSLPQDPAGKQQKEAVTLPLSAKLLSGAAAAAMPAATQATIVYVDLPDEILWVGPTSGLSDIYNLDINGDTHPDISFSVASEYIFAHTYTLGVYAVPQIAGPFDTTVTDLGGYILPYPAGENISSSSSFDSVTLLARDKFSFGTYDANYGGYGHLYDGSDFFIGFNLVKDDLSAYHYGWVRLALNEATDGTNPNQLTIKDFAYNSVSGGAILTAQTSAIPEPASAVGLLALGAAGLAAWRARRREREKAAPAA